MLCHLEFDRRPPLAAVVAGEKIWRKKVARCLCFSRGGGEFCFFPGCESVCRVMRCAERVRWGGGGSTHDLQLHRLALELHGPNFLCDAKSGVRGKGEERGRYVQWRLRAKRPNVKDQMDFWDRVLTRQLCVTQQRALGTPPLSQEKGREISFVTTLPRKTPTANPHISS